MINSINKEYISTVNQISYLNFNKELSESLKKKIWQPMIEFGKLLNIPFLKTYFEFKEKFNSIQGEITDKKKDRLISNILNKFKQEDEYFKEFVLSDKVTNLELTDLIEYIAKNESKLSDVQKKTFHYFCNMVRIQPTKSKVSTKSIKKEEKLKKEIQKSSDKFDKFDINVEQCTSGKCKIDLPDLKNIIYGKTSKIVTPTRNLECKYAIVELEDLIQSNDPFTFTKNPQYPEVCQTRNYNETEGEQRKVTKYSENFESEHLLNNSPDATTGPPIIMKSGIVLGGNGRTMILKNVVQYYKMKFINYVNDLKALSKFFGFDADLIDDFDKPVLVRIIEADIKECSTFSNILNQSTTQKIDALQEAIGFSKQLEESEGIYESIANIFETSDESTFLQTLDNRAASESIIHSLRKIGIINDVNASDFLEDGKTLSSKGKDFLEYLLLASVLPDKRLLTSAKSFTNKILRALPYFIRMKNLPSKWNLIPYIQEAIRKENDRKGKGLSVTDYIDQIDAFSEPLHKYTVVLWKLLSNKSSLEFKKFITYFVDRATESVRNSDMFGNDVQPDDIFDLYTSKNKLSGLDDNLSGLDGINSAFQKYGKHFTKSRIKSISEEIDPTENKKYTEAIIKWFVFEPMLYDDVWVSYSSPERNEFVDIINKFHYLVKHKIVEGEKSNIDNFKDFYSFKRFVDNEIDKNDKKTNDLIINKYKVNKNFEVVFDNEEFIILKVLNREGALEFDFTSWCITSHSTNYYQTYTNEGVQFYFVINKYVNSESKYKYIAVAVYPDGKKEIYNKKDYLMNFVNSDNSLIYNNDIIDELDKRQIKHIDISKYQIKLPMEVFKPKRLVNNDLSGLKDMISEAVKDAVSEIAKDKPELIGIDDKITVSDDVSETNESQAKDIVSYDNVKQIQITEIPIQRRTKMLLNRLCYPFSMLIWGLQGQGKSSLALIFAVELSRFGKTLYWTNEEKLNNGRITQRMNILGLYSNNLYFDDNGQFNQLVNTLNTHKDLKFIIIDSINFLDAQQIELLKLKDEFPEICFIYIAHSEKMGRHFKGEGKIAFAVDCEIKVENGIAEVRKHRDAPSGSTLDIFINQNQRKKYRTT